MCRTISSGRSTHSRFFFGQIAEYERRYNDTVSFPTSGDFIAAGGGELDGFGVLNVVDALAGGSALRWEEAMNLDNSTVLAKMQMDAKRATVESRMFERRNKS